MNKLKKSDFYYDLPEHLIAQTPVTPRDHSRMMQVDRRTGEIRHLHFYELPKLLKAGDLLVVNDSRVLPARLLGNKEGSGGAMEFLLLEKKERDLWEVLARPGRKALPGTRFLFGSGRLCGEVVAPTDSGGRLVRFSWEGDFYKILEQIGHAPLPPYIKRELSDAERYQTVYSNELGSSAAPTAGLHFTEELLSTLRQKGVQIESITLHVGLGTFRPVKEENIENHRMHSEHYTLSEKTAEAIRVTKQNGGRVIAVGTTSTRTLEAIFQKYGEIRPCSGETDIFIRPGYTFQVLDGLVTNFHLPESTLIMLVSAFLGYEETMNCYREAVREQYRFFSFGDSMLIL